MFNLLSRQAQLQLSTFSDMDSFQILETPLQISRTCSCPKDWKINLLWPFQYRFTLVTVIPQIWETIASLGPRFLDVRACLVARVALATARMLFISSSLAFFGATTLATYVWGPERQTRRGAGATSYPIENVSWFSSLVTYMKLKQRNILFHWFFMPWGSAKLE